VSDPHLVDLLTGFFDRLGAARTDAMAARHTGTSSDGLVVVVATAEPVVVDVKVDPSLTGDALTRGLIEATNDALRRATTAAAVKLAAAADGGSGS
jgi:DNA-binding protein YbaB